MLLHRLQSSARPARRRRPHPAVLGLALPGAVALALSGCQEPSNSWGTGVVKGTDGFGDYAEAVVAIPKPTAGPRQFQCAGPFAPNTTAVNIAADFGQANVTTTTVNLPGGGTDQGLALLPGDPALRVDISWQDAIDMVSPQRVAFTEASAWTVNGVGIGTSLSALEKANGRAFQIQGFGGAGGGVVADWRGGRLANIGAGCRLGVQLALPAGAAPAAQISGTARYSSSSAAMRAAQPTVGLFWVNYP